MECMEEGYLAKILKGDGSKEIKLGEVLTLSAVGKEDIAKFKDYNPSASGSGATSANEASAPPPPFHTRRKLKNQLVYRTKNSKPSAAPDGDRAFASPLARKLAEDHNVPLSSIKGTVLMDILVKADIEDYLGMTIKLSTLDDVGFFVVLYPRDLMDKCYIAALHEERKLQRQSLSPRTPQLLFRLCDHPSFSNKKGDSFTACLFSKQTSPLLFNSGYMRRQTYGAAALALRKVPQCNSSWTDNYIRHNNNVNINVAVQTDNGLYVPVIRDADKKGLSKIGDEVKNLAQKARENSLKPEDYEGGTFTVSNLGGPFGIKQFCAIINPPQSGILAIGSERKSHPWFWS
ncbi:hypothetical protein NC652_010009 [Populus alba x Populus x berolinensis]|nr:hypothetical protein NC652_010009 [Populus alba x Populus x berolinensis]